MTLTTEEVVKMARQVLSKDIDGLWLAGTPDLEAFAKLVAEAAVAKERLEFAVYAVEIMRRTLKTRGEAT